MNKIKITIKNMEKKKVVTREEFERQKTLKIFGSIILASAAAISLYCYTSMRGEEVEEVEMQSNLLVKVDSDNGLLQKSQHEKTLDVTRANTQVVETGREEKVTDTKIPENTKPALVKDTPKTNKSDEIGRVSVENNKSEIKETKKESNLEGEYDFYLKNGELVYKDEDLFVEIKTEHLLKPTKSIADKNFSLEVNERNPQKILNTLGDEREIYFHTSIVGQKGKKVTHNWYYNGSVQFKKTFNVHGDRWRVWTSKKLWNLKGDEVYVFLTDENGKILDLSVIEK